MGITKIAQNKEYAFRQWVYTSSARDAWSEILESFKKDFPGKKVLLPSYIGWSSNEGSGIFDSVKNAGVDFDFYRLNKNLKIDFEHLKETVSKNDGCLVLLVHYFGFIDAQYDDITKWFDLHNVLYVEDCAHAWLTDLIGGKCGRKGKYAFYSLHKILPILSGGLKVVNRPDVNVENNSINPQVSLNYDLFSIYSKRVENYNYLLRKLSDIRGINVIYKELEAGICPQTLPVILENIDRDMLYHELNRKGFGMVSLYHTMIGELENFDSDAAKYTSKNIINFPVHQDITFNDLDELIENLKMVLNV
ncbi:DegT/DnrJ/EryC1/StrS family aminotransferase [Elizabethkingia anophelis]|uniref:DegT/DnrJ/EryC1/StrS family aminotransferase n=1 Tax=Elizabethkingia anophelis TaxID=1117645 RepID=UPI0004E44017|nr:DegT/DnrJ/EryC1/StrS family aminotransferase [Elizabethkingia anophelis]KFC39614.1 hypothetical protein FF18_10350 [Elizabethkingia anophelis]MCT3788376.1 DegT/DnrJ/EryC1/StrS family aminotransferase [Elizabethkingia anophelis]MCT4287940.1 DegT/DnrJ/EryC1/StrS family aminotransferase [Elizabethkingia anophelis]MDV3501879.1 hypothetical protein [Elizabethkingia anophelis]MDV3568251.1 hypothetical protein [Elizabethkingia anophelis]